MRTVQPGVYLHYKGKRYRVYGEAVKSGTEDSRREAGAVNGLDCGEAVSGSKENARALVARAVR